MTSTRITEPIPFGVVEGLPQSLKTLRASQEAIPRIAKDQKLVAQAAGACREIPTWHRLHLADSRDASFLADESVHLVLTSPPYWTLKRYRETEGQLGHIEVYEAFLDELDRIWRHCFRALVPGGRLVCVVGDVCVARRKNNGRHMVVPLHASIQERCRRIGFDNLAPIIWHKIANAVFEVEGGGGFLGKPYEPNAVIKNDIEYLLMQRKPGAYRKPAWPTRLLSVISEKEHRIWFQQVWTGLTGASTRRHPAPFPLELAERIVRMFSFVGDTVLDPFSGTATTGVAAARWGRNSIGIEVDQHYLDLGFQRIAKESERLFGHMDVDKVLA